jgi:hypothetical protein
VANRQRRAERTFDYSAKWWRAWRQWFFGQLVAAGIPVCCGAALPGGPSPTQSRCRAAGLMTSTSPDGTGLHLHHVPDLTDAEATDRAAICSELRCVVLCRSCHAAATERPI